MKKIILLLVSAMLLLIAGCSDKATLNIYNDTVVTISLSANGDHFQLDNDEYYTNSWNLDQSIFGNDSKDVNIVIDSQLYLFGTSHKIKLSPGDNKDYHIDYDAGAINLINDTDVAIIGVYLSPVNDDYWGDNDLDGEIDSYEDVTWNASPGHWDIRIEFADGDNLTEWDQTIAIGQTLSLEATTGKKGKNTSDQKAEKSKKFQSDTTKDIVELLK